MASRVRRSLKKVAMGILAFLLVLFLLEGVCSFGFFALDLYRAGWFGTPEAAREHLQHDPELGWVSIPNVHLPNLYGPGLHLKTNSQGFRNEHDFGEKTPRGRIRVVCSGNSFTQGYGVGNDQTWCHVLEELDSRLETVNMGSEGYGVDQSYLWYRRDGARLEHDLHVFAFVTEDFFRMQGDQFVGHNKPLLRVQDGRLVPAQTPVPESSYLTAWVTLNARMLARIRIVRGLKAVVSRIRPTKNHARCLSDEEAREVFKKILDELAETNRKKHSTLALVYLPTAMDYGSHRPGPWRKFVRAEARARGILLIDLVVDLQKLHPDDAESLYIREGASRYPGVPGHYSAKGHKWVATLVHEALLEVPAVVEKLRRTGSPSDDPGKRKPAGVDGPSGA